MYSHSVFQYLVLSFTSDHCQCISWCFSWHSRLLILCWLCHHMSIGMCRVVFFFAMINKDEPVIYSFVFWTESPPQRLIFRYSCSLIKICPSYAYSCFSFFCYFTRPCSFGRGNKQLSSTGTDHYMHVHNNKLITWELWSMNFNICFFIFLFFFGKNSASSICNSFMILQWSTNRVLYLPCTSYRGLFALPEGWELTQSYFCFHFLFICDEFTFAWYRTYFFP